MKIAWFSPLPPQHSEIANFTQRLLPDLQARFDARFYCEKPDGFHGVTSGNAYPTEIGHLPPALFVELNRLDLPVYHLGNNPDFFSHTWFLSQAKPGIVVLHDLKLHHFAEGIYRERLRDQTRYLVVMRKHYGSLGYEAGIAYWQQEISIDIMSQHFPLTEWAIQGALGVVVHTAHALEIIRKLTDVPVVLAPLPHEAQVTAEAVDTRRGDRGAPSASSPVQVIMFGYLNVNRRVVEFLAALAGMPERDRFEVQIYGAMQHQREVESAVGALGLRDKVKLHGYVSEATLAAGLAAADIAVNLRYPTMGEASASQLRIWDHALPSLVTFAEGYAGLPPETVFFVRPDHEEADIQRHLRAFLAHPETFREAGRRGRQWLLDQHRPAVYVERLGELCLAADELRSRHNQLRLADRVGTAIAPWTDAAPIVARESYYAAAIAQTV